MEPRCFVMVGRVKRAECPTKTVVKSKLMSQKPRSKQLYRNLGLSVVVVGVADMFDDDDEPVVSTEAMLPSIGALSSA